MTGRRMAPLALLLALVAAACGATPSASPSASRPPSAVPGGSGTPVASPDTPGSPAPGETTPTPADTPAASPAPTPGPSAEPPTAPPGDDGTSTCAGSAENRDFFAAAAEAFTWDVYCAALPDGWFVHTGSYRLADGGSLVISYRGPGDAWIELREGAFCTEGASACSPRDHELGPAAFGDRSGTLVTLGPNESDGFAIYVDPGAAPSWSITGKGMDSASFEAIAAALLRMGG